MIPVSCEPGSIDWLLSLLAGRLLFQPPPLTAPAGDMAGTIPTSWAFPLAQSIMIHGTNLSGALPPDWGNNPNLRLLYLEESPLSGELPASWISGGVLNFKEVLLGRCSHTC
jgi:hypothetical protein